MSEKQLNYYISLSNLNYQEIVDFLNKKYGNVSDDYFREASYNRFLNHEIKTPSKGKFSRSKEGLYTHHVNENKYLNMSKPEYIHSQEIPFSSQKKENLVYADLVEHAILHTLIIKETNGHFGYPGYNQFIRKMIIEWKIWNTNPKPLWMKKAKEIIDLTPRETSKLLDILQEIINPFLDTDNFTFLDKVRASFDFSPSDERIKDSWNRDEHSEYLPVSRFENFQTIKGIERFLSETLPYGNRVQNLVRYRFKKKYQNFDTKEESWDTKRADDIIRLKQLQETYINTFQEVTSSQVTLTNEQIINIFEKRLKKYFKTNESFLKEDKLYWSVFHRELAQRETTRSENYQYALNEQKSILFLFSREEREKNNQWIKTHPQLLLNGISRKTSKKELIEALRDFPMQNFLFWRTQKIRVTDENGKLFFKMANQFTREELENALEKLLNRQNQKLKKFIVEREKIELQNHGYTQKEIQYEV